MIPIRYMLAAMAVILLLTAGCGGAATPKRTLAAYTAKQNLYHTETVTLDGRPLLCVVRQSGNNGDAISCDWIAFNYEPNGLPYRTR